MCLPFYFFSDETRTFVIYLLTEDNQNSRSLRYHKGIPGMISSSVTKNLRDVTQITLPSFRLKSRAEGVQWE